MYLVKSFLILGALVSLAESCTDRLESTLRSDNEQTGENLQTIIEKINARIANENLPLQTLSKDKVLEWFHDYLPFAMVKEERLPILRGLEKGILIKPYTIEIDLREDIPVPDLPKLIVFRLVT